MSFIDCLDENNSGTLHNVRFNNLTVEGVSSINPREQDYSNVNIQEIATNNIIGTASMRFIEIGDSTTLQIGSFVLNALSVNTAIYFNQSIVGTPYEPVLQVGQVLDLALFIINSGSATFRYPALLQYNKATSRFEMYDPSVSTGLFAMTNVLSANQTSVSYESTGL